MLSKNFLCLAFAAPMTIVLHGCGGGGGSTAAPESTAGPTTPSETTTAPTTPGGSTAASTAPSTTPSGTTTAPTTPGPSPPAPPTPWDPETAVKALNNMYMDFDETNDDSGLGVTISMAGIPTTLDANLFCAPLMNTSCHNGEADCRMSSTLFNHKVVVSGNLFAPTMSRPIGYVFNQVLTETYFGKCSYIYDGNNFDDLNVGCGAGAKGADDCSDPLAAFYDQCSHDPEEPHNCTRTDFEVESRLCKCEPPICDETYGAVSPPATNDDATCFYEMPALIYGNSTQTSHLRDGLKQRIALQGNNSDLTQQWNEVVIDNRLLIPKIRSDPTNTILAFVCIPAQNPAACTMAAEMRDSFHETYSVTGVGVPVVAIDTTLDFTANGGPFVLPPDSQVIV